MGRNQYPVATERVDIVLDSMPLKPFLSTEDVQTQTTLTPPLHYYTDQEFFAETGIYVIEDILDQKEVKSGRKKYVKWYVKYKGYPQPEWHTSSAFMHDVNEDWVAYNK